MIKSTTSVILFYLLITNLDALAQELNGEWKIDEILGYNENVELYSISQFDPNFPAHGNHIVLTDSTFESFYTAPCGNDCFKYSNGTYKFIDENYIEFFIEKTSVFCYGYQQKIENYPNRILGVFFVEQNGETIILRKAFD